MAITPEQVRQYQETGEATMPEQPIESPQPQPIAAPPVQPTMTATDVASSADLMQQRIRSDVQKELNTIKATYAPSLAAARGQPKKALPQEEEAKKQAAEPKITQPQTKINISIPTGEPYAEGQMLPELQPLLGQAGDGGGIGSPTQLDYWNVEGLSRSSSGGG